VLACLLGVAATISSAPFLALLLGLGLLIYDRLFGRLEWQWSVLWIAGITLVTVFACVADNPLAFLIANFTLDPVTGYFRLLIWEWAAENIAGSPVIGVGMDDWIRPPGMPPSIDSLWLVQAVRHGLPGSVLLGCALVTPWVTLSPRRLVAADDDAAAARVRCGVTVAIALAVFLGFTVHFWGLMWGFLGLLVGLRAALEEDRFVGTSPVGEVGR
jgi:hypothetical protein